MGDLPGGGATAELKPAASHSTSFAAPNPFGIGTENWVAADRAVRETIRKVQPTSVSEERRREVVDYIQRLVRNCLGAEVLPYGSVPLKTYLPDGDIDLTAFGGANVEDILADDMKTVLEEEEKNMAAEFVIKDVQLIRAEVKLVKCIVQDIVVDISFNQIGGLCTLCFLEQVDRLIGQDHLFKRSIILIKAWCYYESRILGAHHGLISTYALETLVLYIFHLFHSTLDGPLAVLYKFLDYFSKFDWETYCISLNGPIRLSTLPAIIAEMPEDSDGDLLLSSDFLSSCVGMFSVPSRVTEQNLRGFQQKHLNIVDPLKAINNLGRSVSKGNFYRIRSAFSYGARKLARILYQPEDSIANELQRFFSNTMARHGGGKRHDIQDFDTSLICNRPVPGVPISESWLCKVDNFHEKFDEYAVSSGDFQSSSGKSSQDLLKGTEKISDFQSNSRALGPRLHGDSTDLATSALGALKISTDSSIRQTPVPKESVNAVIKPFFAPHLYFANSKLQNRNSRDGNSDSDKCNKGEKNASSSVLLESSGSPDENQMVDTDETVASSKPMDLSWPTKSLSFSGDPNHMDSSDLSGDYESHLQCLRYGRWCYEYGLGIQSLPIPPLPTIPYQNPGLWDGFLPHSHYKQNGFSHRHHNGFHPTPALYPLQPVLLPGVSFGWEEVPKPRGTGTYFPNMIQPPLGYRSSSMKGRNQGPSRAPHNNGRNMIFMEPNMLDRSSHEPPQHHIPVDNNVMVSSSSDSYLSFTPHANGYHNANGGLFEEVVETTLSEINRQQKPVTSSPRTLSEMQKSQPALRKEQDRISSLSSSYRLKDEDDFPPLPV